MNIFRYFNKNFKVLITYGSQTGNAETISHILKKQLSSFFISDIEICPLNDVVNIQSFNTYDFVIILLSTTGDGDFPDNSNKFWRICRKYFNKDLDKTNYCILGLGSSDYNNFCSPSKSLDMRLRKNKANSFLPIEFADDATGLQDVVDPWLEKITSFLKFKQKNIQNWFIKSMTS